MEYNTEKGIVYMKILHKRTAALLCAAATAFSAAPYLSGITGSAAGSIVINEVCTKNTVQAAPNGQFYDYVELYNPGSSAVSVAGWGLSDSAELPFRYTLPANSSVPAKGFLVIYCGISETDTGVTGADFGLAKKGETVILTDAQGSTVESLEIPALDDNTAFGRVPDGSDTFAVLQELSCGKSNPTGAVSKIAVDLPVFSQDSGFYASEFNLTLSAKSGSTVYYTTDGSDPTTASTKYTSAIRVYDRSAEENVLAAKTGIADSYSPPTKPIDKAMIVRAIAVDADGNVSDIATKSYFIGYSDSDLVKQMRVISLVTDPDNLFDYETGIYVQGKVRDDWRNGPDYDPMTASYFQPANYTQKGREWERPAYMTVFENGKAAYSAPLGIRVHGGATRSSAQKSLNFYARSDYGVTQFDYDFFGGTLISEATGQPITKFDSLTIRNGGNDNDLKIRDRLNQEMMAGRDCLTLAQTECIVYLDGEFWGLYNLMEKPSEEMIHDHYDVKAKDVCRIKTDELSDGTDAGLADYEALKKWATETDYTAAGVWEKFTSMVEPQSFADMMAAEIIVNNTDFGNNNYSLWKTETVNESKPYADGRWRFILFDTELGQGLYGTTNSGSSILQSLKSLKNCWIDDLFFGLMDNVPEFREMMVATCFDLCNENYSSANVTARLSELSSAYSEAAAASMARFNGSSNPWGGGWVFPGMGPGQGPGQDPGQGQETDPIATYRSTFSSGISTLQNFWQQRAQNVKSQILNATNGKIANTTTTVSVTNAPQKGAVKLNTLTLTESSWSGTYPTELPITLQALPKAGYIFTGWNVTGAEFITGSASSAYAKIQPSGNVTITASYAAANFSKTDVQKLQAYLLKSGSLTESEAASYDLDGNGKLNARDLTLLKRVLLG